MTWTRSVVSAVWLVWLAATPGITRAEADCPPPPTSVAPQRIVSLVPALTEMVFAMGAGDRLIAVSSYDRDPPEVRALPRVGALLDPDVERIIAMRADLVLLYGSQTDLMTQLARAAIPYYEYRHGGLAGVTATIRSLGLRIGASARATTLAAAIEARIAGLRRRTAGGHKPRTLLIFGRDGGTLRNIYASGGVGFLHDMLEAAGGANVFADVGSESVQASSELILARAPEVIIELQPSADPTAPATNRDIGAWRGLASLPAVRQGRVHVLAGRWHVVPGPRVADTAAALAAILHPPGPR
jgi:iron complex transport system substrate-binding protein